MKKKKVIIILLLPLVLVALVALIIFQNVNEPAKPNSAPFPAMAVKGPEVWSINGDNWEISYTYYIGFNDGSLQYCIDFPYKFEGKDLSKSEALDMVFPLIEYSYQNNLFNRTPLKDKGRIVPVSLIGVSLIEKTGITTSSFRVQISLDDIKGRIA
jgi:hypothetical protein